MTTYRPALIGGSAALGLSGLYLLGSKRRHTLTFDTFWTLGAVV